jgi:hypothetical protein
VLIRINSDDFPQHQLQTTSLLTYVAEKRYFFSEVENEFGIVTKENFRLEMKKMGFV